VVRLGGRAAGSPGDDLVRPWRLSPLQQLWDAQDLRLLLVADFETSGIAEPEYAFRAIPSFGPGIDLLASTTDQYMALTGKRLSLERIMALHLRTSLGDAL
jgi:hypothetical protein